MESDMTIKALLADATLKVASLPPHNGDIGGVGPLTVPLIAEDYPAKTAVMWNEAYKRFGLPDRNSMVLADPKNAAVILDAFRADPRYVGGGAGIGFKVAVVPHLDEVTPLARAVGAVNIIKKEGGRLIGDNTDGLGYAESLESMRKTQGATLQGTRVAVLGAGGTGKGIGFALADKGAQITILNRTPGKALELAAAINTHFGKELAVGGGRELLAEILPSQDAIVSVVDDAHSPLDRYSPLGDMPSPATDESVKENLAQSARRLKLLKRGCIVSDIRLRKEETPMLAQARKQGFPILDGLPMVVNQGVAAFWWLYGTRLKNRSWTREDVLDVMWRAIS